MTKDLKQALIVRGFKVRSVKRTAASWVEVSVKLSDVFYEKRPAQPDIGIYNQPLKYGRCKQNVYAFLLHFCADFLGRTDWDNNCVSINL